MSQPSEERRAKLDHFPLQFGSLTEEDGPCSRNCSGPVSLSAHRLFGHTDLVALTARCLPCWVTEPCGSPFGASAYSSVETSIPALLSQGRSWCSVILPCLKLECQSCPTCYRVKNSYNPTEVGIHLLFTHICKGITSRYLKTPEFYSRMT